MNTDDNRAQHGSPWSCSAMLMKSRMTLPTVRAFTEEPGPSQSATSLQYKNTAVTEMVNRVLPTGRRPRFQLGEGLYTAFGNCTSRDSVAVQMNCVKRAIVHSRFLHIRERSPQRCHDGQLLGVSAMLRCRLAQNQGQPSQGRRGPFNDRILHEVSRTARHPGSTAGHNEERAPGHARQVWRVRHHDIQDWCGHLNIQSSPAQFGSGSPREDHQ